MGIVMERPRPVIIVFPCVPQRISRRMSRMTLFFLLCPVLFQRFPVLPLVYIWSGCLRDSLPWTMFFCSPWMVHSSPRTQSKPFRHTTLISVVTCGESFISTLSSSPTGPIVPTPSLLLHVYTSNRYFPGPSPRSAPWLPSTRLGSARLSSAAFLRHTTRLANKVMIERVTRLFAQFGMPWV